MPRETLTLAVARAARGPIGRFADHVPEALHEAMDRHVPIQPIPSGAMGATYAVQGSGAPRNRRRDASRGPGAIVRRAAAITVSSTVGRRRVLDNEHPRRRPIQQ